MRDGYNILCQSGKIDTKYQVSKQRVLTERCREVENNYVLTEGESKYYIPTYFIQKYEDDTLWFKINEDEAKNKFMLGTTPTSGPF